VHPSSIGDLLPYRPPVAQARHPCGTQESLLTVASFRTWRGSQAPAAQDPVVNAPSAGRCNRPGPRTGIRPRY